MLGNLFSSGSDLTSCAGYLGSTFYWPLFPAPPRRAQETDALCDSHYSRCRCRSMAIRLCERWPSSLFAVIDLFLLACVLYDLTTRRRVYPATLWGAP